MWWAFFYPKNEMYIYFCLSFANHGELAKVAEGEQGSTSAPWELVPPELEVYRERGHRRLAARTYDSKCGSCMWGCRMPVEIIIDNWNARGRKKYRFETFCYGPLSCKVYKAGPNRKVCVWQVENAANGKK